MTTSGRRRAVAAEVGIDEVISEVLPADKVGCRATPPGGRVALSRWSATASMTLPLLRRLTSGSPWEPERDVAIEASDLTLMRGDLRAAADAIRLSRATLRTIKGNLFWAFAYNVAAIPLAAFGLLNPLIAAAAMAFSSLFVVSNSLQAAPFQAGGAAGEPGLGA